MAKRKAKSPDNHRKSAIRQDYEMVLIVCEGKTEQLYFQGLRDELKISTANIKVLNPKQNTPNSLLKEAKIIYEKSKKDSNPFDKVYCIFDKDKHPKYQQTKNSISIQFELWSNLSRHLA
ncbi:MAG: RloB domain-containing protein [Candidatus Thioglobus sp.]|nr:RloB domain-containing protein [Candidatus Thioglobus sp.]